MASFMFERLSPLRVTAPGTSSSNPIVITDNDVFDFCEEPAKASADVSAYVSYGDSDGDLSGILNGESDEEMPINKIRTKPLKRIGEECQTPEEIAVANQTSQSIAQSVRPRCFICNSLLLLEGSGGGNVKIYGCLAKNNHCYQTGICSLTCLREYMSRLQRSPVTATCGGCRNACTETFECLICAERKPLTQIIFCSANDDCSGYQCCECYVKTVSFSVQLTNTPCSFCRGIPKFK